MPKLLTIEKSLLSIFPEIANQWHEDLNGQITPDKVFPKSNKEFWWRCSSNSNHIWKASPNTRVRSGCPFCAGKITESLAALYDKKIPIGVSTIMLIHIPINGDASPALTAFSQMVDIM